MSRKKLGCRRVCVCEAENFGDPGRQFFVLLLYRGTGDVIKTVVVDTGNTLIYVRPEVGGYNLAGYPSGGSQKLGG